jgi:hypothetical protein
MHSSVSAFNLPGNVSLDLLDQSLDVRVVAAAAVAGLAAAVVIAIVAGAFSFSARVADALRARGSTPRLVRRRTRSILVIVQTAVAVVLVAGAGLLARSLVEALRLNPGYDTTQLITTHVDPAPSGYDRVRAGTLFEELRTRLLQRPSVRNVAFVRFGSGMGAGGNLRIDGTPRAVPSMTEFRVVDERYFATLGLRVRHGRDFGREDVAGSPLVGIVSESLGRFVANGGDPIGRAWRACDAADCARHRRARRIAGRAETTRDGLRAALGATGRQLGSLLLVETVRLAGGGVILGLALSWLAADTIEAFLFQVRPLDVPTLAVVTAAVLILAVAVSVRPALRVARVDLASVLREE